MRRAAALLLGLLAAAAPPEPQSFRTDHYRADVPDTLQGARVMHVAELERFIASSHPVLIDVLPAPHPPVDARGLPRLPLPVHGLPGTVWLPEVGRGALTPAANAWFASRLAALTHGDRAAPIVFYCLSRCWMSWNAARRAVALGYTGVVWFPDGADGWEAAGKATTDITPEKGVLF